MITVRLRCLSSIVLPEDGGGWESGIGSARRRLRRNARDDVGPRRSAKSFLRQIIALDRRRGQLRIGQGGGVIPTRAKPDAGTTPTSSCRRMPASTGLPPASKEVMDTGL